VRHIEDCLPGICWLDRHDRNQVTAMVDFVY